MNRSTAVIHFVAPERIYYAYPALTFRHLSMINPGPLYFDRAVERLSKYESRGLLHAPSDGWQGMWVDITILPRVFVNRYDLFALWHTMRLRPS